MKQVENVKTGLETFSRWEILLYFTVYISYLVYGLNALLAIRDKILEVAAYQFSLGWSLLNRPRDDSNDELENFSQFIQKSWHWYVLHLCISVALRIGLLRRPGLAYAVFSALFLLITFHPASVVVVFILLCSYYAASKRSTKADVWILSGVWILIINVLKSSDVVYELLGYEEYFMLVVLLSWTMLRCCSFALNRINDVPDTVTQNCSEATWNTPGDQMYSVEHYLGYALYFPTLIHGPFLGFRRYIVVIQDAPTQLHRCSSLIWLLLRQLLRVFFWWLVMYFSLHFLYIHYMERDIVAVRLIENSYTQYAIVYFMGQFFFMYYVVTYGLGIAIASFDGLDPPKRPRCIGRIHFYSDMWKFFDEGLYEFLFHHIYAELCAKNSVFLAKLFATTATFSFIFVWHGCYEYVLIWSLLNFVCLVAEKLFKKVTSSKRYLELVTMHLGSQNSQRLRALMATQIFIPAAYSNVYFISGSRVGNLLMYDAYCSGVANYLLLTFCSYCFFQCSEIISNLQSTKKVSSKQEQ